MGKQYKAGTNRGMIQECANAGKSKRETLNELRPLVLSGEMQFKRNPTAAEKMAGITNRIVKPTHEQLIELKNEIGRVFAIMGKSDSADFDAPEITPQPDPQPEIQDENEPEDEPEDRPRAKGKERIKNELARFAARMVVIRKFLADRLEMSDPIDDLGNRPEWAAARLIPAGIPVEALLDTMTLHWPQDARNECGITKFDFKTLSKNIAKERGIDISDKHEMFGYLVVLVENRIPVWMGGPQGTGKSTLARQIAEHLGLPYGEIGLNAGASRSDLLGRLTASPLKPFILSKFCEMFSNGGVFCLEEVDAALPEVLVALNNALAGSAGDPMFNSANGDDYTKHEDFVPIATANTWGLGANRLYLRERLDSATLDRFRMGRVFVELDMRIVNQILFSQV